MFNGESAERHKHLLLHLELENYHAIDDTKRTNFQLFASRLELTRTSIHILTAPISLFVFLQLHKFIYNCTFCVELGPTH